jgi:DNA-binding transcriptional ArsR family regulator
VIAYRTTLAILADPTRRKVFERLRAGPRPVNALAAGLPVSRPGVSQHLKALKDAGLVEERSEGVRRIYSLRREGLMELRDWLDSFWSDALEAFKAEAEKTRRMTTTIAIAPVRKTIRVKAPIAHAFEVFTSGLTRWWPHDHGVGKKPIMKVLLEPRLGGRWLEIAEDGTQTVVATITHWKPPHRVVMVWQVNAQMEAGCGHEIRGGCAFFIGRRGCDASRSLTPQIRNDGRGRRSLYA